MNNNKAKVLIFTAKDSYSRKQHLGKTITFDGSHVVKNTSSTPANGTIQNLEFSLQELQKLLANFPQNQAIVTGQVLDSSQYIQSDDVNYLNCTSKGKEHGRSNTISRTKEYIGYDNSSGFLLVDYDPEENTKSLTANELHQKLCSVHSGFTGAGYVAKYSSSAGLITPDGQPNKKSNGFHMYYFVENGASIPAFIEELYAACWLKGYGYIKVAKNGNKLDRTSLFDKSATASARFIFEANPSLSGGLTRKVPPVEIIEGNWLDTSSINIDHNAARLVITKAKDCEYVVKEANNNKKKYSNKMLSLIHI